MNKEQVFEKFEEENKIIYKPSLPDNLRKLERDYSRKLWDSLLGDMGIYLEKYPYEKWEFKVLCKKPKRILENSLSEYVKELKREYREREDLLPTVQSSSGLGAGVCLLLYYLGVPLLISLGAIPTITLLVYLYEIREKSILERRLNASKYVEIEEM